MLILGGAGGVGHFAIQIAKALGEKTSANCGPSNFEFLQSLGADHVIDYSGKDFMADLDRFERRHFDDNSSPPLAGRSKRSSSPFRRGTQTAHSISRNGWRGGGESDAGRARRAHRGLNEGAGPA